MTLTGASYLGGSDRDEALAVAVDAHGSAVITGMTESTDFPTLSPLQGTLNGNDDAFVVRVRGADGPQGYSYVLGSLAHASGAAGSQWRSNVIAVADDAGPASIALTFLDGSASETRTTALGAGDTIEWQDVLVSLFGYAASDQVSGSMLITSDQPLDIVCRTYNQATSGTFGQYIPALTTGDGVTSGRPGKVPGLKRNTAFRSNLGAVNLTEGRCDLRITVHGPGGEQIGSALTMTLEAWEWRQINDVLGSAGAGDRNLAYAVVEVVGSGEAWAYGSVVDNVTNDPTTIPVLVR
jgi:hypothetical protein